VVHDALASVPTTHDEADDAPHVDASTRVMSSLASSFGIAVLGLIEHQPTGVPSA